jgi:predicted transcriptional regulator
MANSAENPIRRELVAKIIESYVKHHNLAVDEFPMLITAVHQSLSDLGKPLVVESRIPAVPVGRSVQREHVVCLECGYRGQILRRHMRVEHHLAPEEYRARWGLPSDHPLIAPAYSERRSTMAKSFGLGRKRALPTIEPTLEPGAQVAPEPALDPAFAASLGRGRARRGRPRAKPTP